jgi:hypothetical protein
MFTNQDSNANHFLILIKVTSLCLAYSLFNRVFQAIALFSADEHEEAMLLIKELATACPNTDPLARHVVEVSVMRLCLVIDGDLCNLHIRHICAFSSESMIWTPHVTKKLLTTSLLLLTSVPGIPFGRSTR